MNKQKTMESFKSSFMFNRYGVSTGQYFRDRQCFLLYINDFPDVINHKCCTIRR